MLEEATRTLETLRNMPLIRGFTGAPEGIRTPNLLIRSQMLYPLSYGRFWTSVSGGPAPPSGEPCCLQERWHRAVRHPIAGRIRHCRATIGGESLLCAELLLGHHHLERAVVALTLRPADHEGQ